MQETTPGSRPRLNPSLPITLIPQIPRITVQIISPLTTTQSSHIIEHMSDATTAERKPPTLADIVREKTDDGRLIIDFFIDVMEARVEGAELCHRIDAAKQLVSTGQRTPLGSSPGTAASPAGTPPVDAPTRTTRAPARWGAQRPSP